MPAFSILLVAMLVDLLMGLLLATTAAGVPAARAAGAIVLTAALYATGVRRRGIVFLFAAALIAQLMAGRWSHPPIVTAATALRLVFLCYVVAIILWRILHDSRVTLDTVAGTACVYMLFGFAWANVYMLVEGWRPGSLVIPDAFLGPERNPGAALTYFSFVTLTTLGYGIVHPANPGVGGVCIIEALVGQLYLAIMIARMVGLHIAGQAR
jgi:hypothetical protein